MLPPTLPIPPTFFGLTTQNFQQVHAELEAGTLRTWDVYNGTWDAVPGLAWPQIEPTPGTYRLQAVEAFLQQSAGKEVIYTFGRTPRWASTRAEAPGIYGPGECAPPALAAWDGFVSTLARAAAGRIAAWELWNEPGYAGSYCGDLPALVTLAGHAARLVKAADPHALMLSPSPTAAGGPAWLTRFFDLGGYHSVDVVAFHGYLPTQQAEDLPALIAPYRALAERYRMPLWDTEFSWAGSDGGKHPVTDPGERAAFLAKSFLLHWSSGVTRVVWYAYDGQAQWGQLWDAQRGLHADGVAYREVRRWMEGAVMPQPCRHDAAQTWTCTLTRDNGYRAEVLWNAQQAFEVHTPKGFLRVRTLGGAVRPASALLRLGVDPVLLETNAP